MSLAERSVSALKWNYVGGAIRALAQLSIGIVLARLLGPEPFGLVAIAWLVIGLGNLVADLGLSSALVQREHIHESDIRFVFTLLMLLGLLFTIVLFFGAGLVAEFFRRRDASPVLQWLSLLFIAQAFGQTSASLLRRALNMRAVQIAQISSYLTAYILLGIPLAITGIGVWSLVAATLAQAFLYSGLLFFQHPHSLSPTLVLTGKGYAGFGAKVLGGNLANYTINNVDSTVIGRAFGAVDLGLYTRASQLVTIPINTLLTNLMGVLFPVYSRLQQDVPTIRRAYMASLTLTAMLSLPILTSMASVSEAVVVGLYGNKWVGAVELFVPLALAMSVHALLALGGPVMTGTGRPGLELRVQGAVALIMVGALSVAAQWSVVVVAWTLLAVFIARFVLVTHAALSLVEGRWLEVWRAVAGPIAVSGITVSAVLGTDLALSAVAITPSLRLVADAVVGGVALCAGSMAVRRWLLTAEVTWVARRIESRLPRFLRTLMRPEALAR